MRIVFKKLIIHNFLSYGHSEIDLQDKGYCLVSGQNNCPKDNALSNGSGKSSWTSAICWALTGETIQGTTQNIKNINIEEKSCYVTLQFKVNKDEFVITRFKEPKPDMKIMVNGEDKSGKGIRESELALSELLPDLTTNLIASIIILGQGLPCKFSNNSPSGRKEVLEKLSKSDFMIEDLKQRLNLRITTLDESHRKYEDLILSDTSKKSIYDKQLEETTEKLKELEKPHDFDTEISSFITKINELETSLNERKKALKEKIKEVTTLNESLRSLLNEKNTKITEDNEEFDSQVKSQYLKTKYSIEADIKNLEAEIKKLKAITDVCPTCGQKIPGAHKPDTTKQEENLTTLKESLTNLENKYKTNETAHIDFLNKINEEYKTSIDNLTLKINTQTKNNETEDADLTLKNIELIKLNENKAKAELNKTNYLKELQDVQKNIKSLTENVSQLQKEIKENTEQKTSIENHLNVLSQMSTLIKRDFRGVLLSNVISFIDMKAKEYAQDIFGSNELEFKLDGNNIDILYCNKMFESLSGGEKQKVDLIIQFAIRDMMSQYLDFSSNILVLDEITDNLDSIGCNNVLNLISSKLNDIESVFIISHHADELSIPCDTEMLVVKDRNGISSIK